EGIAPVELGPDLVQTAYDDSRGFGGKMRRIRRSCKAVDGNAGDALQGLGDGFVRERAKVRCGDRFHDGVGIALEHLRIHQVLTNAGRYDFLDDFVVVIVVLCERWIDGERAAYGNR